MKKLKLKSWVVPALYAVSLGVIFVSIVFIGKVMATDYARAVDSNLVPVSDNNIVDDTPNDVTQVVEVTNETVGYPYLLEGVTVAKDYYVEDAEEDSQIKSLIYYKNTYMVNTGVLYTNPEQFDVVSVLDGSVTSITDDEILGKVVEVTHTTELISIYHCLGEVNVKVGDNLKQNDVIGKSGKVNIDNGYENALLFEVNYQGKILNPNDFYKMKVSDLAK